MNFSLVNKANIVSHLFSQFHPPENTTDDSNTTFPQDTKASARSPNKHRHLPTFISAQSMSNSAVTEFNLTCSDDGVWNHINL